MTQRKGANGGTHEQSDLASDHIVTVMNHGWLSMLLSLGERLDLHKHLAHAKPMTAAALAKRAELDERYVTEWLWGMAAGKIIEVTPATEVEEDLFQLPSAYVSVMTSAGGPLHWSRITTQITALATLEDALVGAFESGEGLSASHYEGRIAQVFSGESGPIFERVLLNEVLPLTGKVSDLEQGARFTDLGCGTGTAALIIAKRFPNCTVTGVDQSPSSIALAKARAREAGLKNVTFVCADLEEGLDIENQDLILAANVTHDLSDPGAFFTRVHQALTTGGMFYLHELSSTSKMATNILDPHALGILTFSLYHCLPLAKRRKGIAPGGMWGREKYVDALQQSGFAQVEVHQAPSDPNNDSIFAVRT